MFRLGNFFKTGYNPKVDPVPQQTLPDDVLVNTLPVVLRSLYTVEPGANVCVNSSHDSHYVGLGESLLFVILGRVPLQTPNNQQPTTMD